MTCDGPLTRAAIDSLEASLEERSDKCDDFCRQVEEKEKAAAQRFHQYEDAQRAVESRTRQLVELDRRIAELDAQLVERRAYVMQQGGAQGPTDTAPAPLLVARLSNHNIKPTALPPLHAPRPHMRSASPVHNSAEPAALAPPPTCDTPPTTELPVPVRTAYVCHRIDASQPSITPAGVAHAAAPSTSVLPRWLFGRSVAGPASPAARSAICAVM